MKKQCVVIIPGLFEDIWLMKYITRDWEQKYAITPYIYHFPWKGKTADYQTAFSRAQTYIDTLLDTRKVSLMGRSAGGSLAMNLFLERKDVIERVVNICGRMREGKNNFPPLTFSQRWRPLYTKSVRHCEKALMNISSQTAKKILTIRPLFDELVPTETVSIEGASNKQVPVIGHVVCGYTALTYWRAYLITFVKGVHTAR